MSNEYRDLDVGGQLRAFAVTLEARTAEPIRPGPRPVGDAHEPVVVEPVEMPVQGARRRWLLLAVAAGVVVVASVGTLAVLTDATPSDVPTSSMRTPSGSTPSTTVAAATTTPPITAAPSTSEVGAVGATGMPEFGAESQWTRVEGVEILGVLSDGTTFIAVADLGEGAQLVRSNDGVTWEAYAEPPDVVLEQFVTFVQADKVPFGSDGSPVAVRDGRLVTVLDGGDSVTVHVVEPDGTVSTQEVPVEIPAPFDRFHRELNPEVHLLEDGSIVITAGYSADEALVNASGQSRDELGLPPLYSLPRPIVLSSTDGVTWAQVDTFDTPRVEQVTPAPGGLVALVGPIISGIADLRLSSSTDGVVWQPYEALGADPDVDALVSPFSSGNRTFVAVEARETAGSGQERIWEVTTDGPRLVAGGDAAPEPLELLDSYFFGQLTAGRAGLAYVLAVDPWLVENGDQDPLPNGPGVRYSADDGETWEFQAFPDELATPNPIGSAIAIGGTHIVFVNVGFDGTRELWVTEFPE